MYYLQFFSNEKHTDKSRIIYGKLLPETYMWPIGLALWTMDTVLTKLFYRECLTGLSNPGSCVSYRGPCCARDLGSSSGARRKSRGRRLSGGDEKRRRNLKRWKIATIGDPENSRTRVRRTNFAAAKYPAVFPTETMYLLVREKHPRKRFTGVPVLIYQVHADVLDLISCTEDDSRKQEWEKPRCRLLRNFWNDDEFVWNLIYCTFSSSLTSPDLC